MGWLDKLSNLVRGADAKAAEWLISDGIERGSPPDIEAISAQTKVSHSSVRAMVADAIGADLSRGLEEGFSAGQVDVQGLHDRAVFLGLDGERSKHVIESVIEAHFTALVREVLADGVVDPSEDAQIEAFMRMVGTTAMEPATAALIEQGRAVYRAANAPLTPVEAPVLLKKGEYCVHVVASEALEERSRTVRVGYAGPHARIRIARGIYYSAGSVAVSRQSEDYQYSFGVGVLCVTNKRLLWIGQQKSISTPLSNIVRYDPYSDGLRIMKGTGKPLLFLWKDNGRVATIVATRAIEELRE